jgi:hypothetical protein
MSLRTITLAGKQEPRGLTTHLRLTSDELLAALYHQAVVAGTYPLDYAFRRGSLPGLSATAPMNYLDQGLLCHAESSGCSACWR